MSPQQRTAGREISVSFLLLILRPCPPPKALPYQEWRLYPEAPYTSGEFSELPLQYCNAPLLRYSGQGFLKLSQEGQPPDRCQVPRSFLREPLLHQDGQMLSQVPGR